MSQTLPATAQRSVAKQTAMRSSVDLLVIGGAAIGLDSGYETSRAGQRALVVERDRPGAGLALVRLDTSRGRAMKPRLADAGTRDLHQPAARRTRTRRDDGVRTRDWALLIFLIPLVAVLWPPLYAGIQPEWQGIPYFIWYQFLWTVVAAALTILVYLIRSPGGER